MAKYTREQRQRAVELYVKYECCAADAIRELYPKTGVTAYHMSGKIELASPMQYRKENVNMGLPSLSEYTLYRTDVKAVRSARAVLEEL